MQLPILSRGKQEANSGRVCAEQAVSWLVSGRLDLGDETDHPECVQPVLNVLAIAVNDRMSDEGRARLWPLVLRQPGTARPELEPMLSVQLATYLAIEVRDASRYAARTVADVAARAAVQAHEDLAVDLAARAAVQTHEDLAVDLAGAAARYAAHIVADAAYGGDVGRVDAVLLALWAKTQDYLEELIGTDQVCDVAPERIERLGSLVGVA
jgi:hypothetical protein